MKKIIFLSLLLFVFTGCGGVAKLEISNIQSVYFEYNHASNTNFGEEIEAKIIAGMNGGKEIDITNNRKLTLLSEDIQQKGNSKNFIITKHPTSFDDDFAAVKLTISDKEETFTAFDTIRMNFRGNLNILASGVNGSSGEDQKNRGSRVILRDGKHGENGTIGQNGSSSSNFTAQIWHDENMVYVYMRNTITNEEWKYKTENEGTIRIDLRGGNGGNGGDGGDGGDGKDGRIEDGKSKNPGDGGNGGHGGAGGNGGNGGSIQVFIHPNAEGIRTKLTVQKFGGNGGAGGKSGVAGKPGVALAGQLAGRMGRNGLSGRTGLNGNNGALELTVIEFDIEQFK